MGASSVRAEWQTARRAGKKYTPDGSILAQNEVKLPLPNELPVVWVAFWWVIGRDFERYRLLTTLITLTFVWTFPYVFFLTREPASRSMLTAIRKRPYSDLPLPGRVAFVLFPRQV
jgi:hypothetical protein